MTYNALSSEQLLTLGIRNPFFLPVKTNTDKNMIHVGEPAVRLLVHVTSEAFLRSPLASLHKTPSAGTSGQIPHDIYSSISCVISSFRRPFGLTSF